MHYTALLGLIALAQAGLASAIPALKHNFLHNERRQVAPPYVETVTATFYHTVVWVDQNGRPVSTEIHEPTPAVAPVVQSTPSSKVADVGAPQQQPKPLTQPPPSVSSVSTSSAQSSTTLQTNTAINNGDSKDSSVASGGMGICYDMINSQTQCKTPDTINKEFSFLKSQGYGTIRIYDIGCPVGDFTAAAAKNGLKLMVGLNSIANLNGDLNKLIAMVNGDWSTIDTVYVGNELVNSGAASSGQVAAAVTAGRGILAGVGFHGSVVTVDTFNVMQNDPTICSTSDWCAANAHAYFDPNTAAANAGQFVLNAYNSVVKANGGKKVVITESGWPSQGSCNGKACPSADNQRTAMNSIMTSFSGMPGSIFMFQAYNAGYKAPGFNGVEQFFGIYDADHYVGGIGPS